MIIENTKDCFMNLWHQLESTRQLLAGQSKRFCVRNVLRSWFPRGALSRPRGEEISFDDLVWHVCRLASPDGDILGWTELPPPSLNPRVHRELLRALTQVTLGLNYQQVKLRELERAYGEVFAGGAKLNTNKKRQRPSPDLPHNGEEGWIPLKDKRNADDADRTDLH